MLHVPCVGQIEVNRFAALVYGSIEVLPLTFYFDVGFIDSPGGVKVVTPVPPESLFHLGSIVLDPAVDGGMVHLDTALCHHFFEVAVANAVLAIPADTLEDNLTLEMAPFEVVHVFAP